VPERWPAYDETAIAKTDEIGEVRRAVGELEHLHRTVDVVDLRP
jgi:hypothetical protein